MNNPIFDTPQRQSPVAILLAIVKAFSTIARQIWPLLIVLFIGRARSNTDGYFLIISIIITTLTTLYAIINYFRTYYYVSNFELRYQSGIIGIRKLSIPFDKIQSVNFQQNIIHKIFGVKKLVIDTAGSAEKEFELSAIDDSKANTLKNILLSRKYVSGATGAEVQTKEFFQSSAIEEKILHLSIWDLLKAGVLRNHLKSVPFIWIFGWWVFTTLDDIGIDAYKYLGKSSYLIANMLYIVAFILFVAIVSIIISVILTVIPNYDLKFMRTPHGFSIKRGLFNVNTLAAQDEKIQSISWQDNILKRWAGIVDLILKQAKSGDHKVKDQIILPGATLSHVDIVAHHLYNEYATSEMEMKSVHLSYLERNYKFSYIPIILSFAIAYFLQESIYILIGTSVSVYLLVASYLSYKKLRYGFNEELIKIKGGVFGDKNVLAPIYKLQSISSTQSPYERSRNLATVHLINATDQLSIPFVPMKEVERMIDIFLQKVETNNKPCI